MFAGAVVESPDGDGGWCAVGWGGSVMVSFVPGLLVSDILGASAKLVRLGIAAFWIHAAERDANTLDRANLPYA